MPGFSSPSFLERIRAQAATEGGSGPGSVAWGDITGTLSDQTDLQAALDNKSDIDHTHPGGGTEIEIDVTPITGGTGGRILFESTDNKVSENTEFWIEYDEFGGGTLTVFNGSGIIETGLISLTQGALLLDQLFSGLGVQLKCNDTTLTSSRSLSISTNDASYDIQIGTNGFLLGEVRDEGTPLTTAPILNFTGSGVTASESGGIITVNIPGSGGGSGTVTSVAQSLVSDDTETLTGGPVTTSGTLTRTAVDAGADKLVGWDDSAGKKIYFTLGTGLSTSGTTLNATAITEFRFTADSDTGIDNPAADTIAITLGTTEQIRITGGANLTGSPVSSGSNGRTIKLEGGPPGSSGGLISGKVTVIGGTGGTSNQGGIAELLGGDGTGGAGGGREGGAVTIKGGTGNTSAAGGHVTITGGTAGSTGTPGNLTLIAGTAIANNGGTASLKASPGVGTTKNGGDLTLASGAATAGGTQGHLFLQVQNNVNVLKINGTEKHSNHAGTAPTITAGGGTSPSIIGRDEAFLVTIGTGGSATTVEITFNNAFTNAPIASVGTDTNADAGKFSWVTTTTKITITASAAFTASSKLHVIVRGYE